jgi:hypothetical protein
LTGSIPVQALTTALPDRHHLQGKENIMTTTTTDLPVDAYVAFSGGQHEIYVVLHDWVPNGAEMQSTPLTPVQARALAAELLRAAGVTFPLTH